MTSRASRFSRRTALKGAGAALAMPFVAINARAATTINVLGGPGIHQELWKRWSEMILRDTNGELQVLYNPLGYTAAFSRLQTEQATKRITSDLFYGNAPFPEQAAAAGLLDTVPFDQLPNTLKLYPSARKPYGLAIFQFVWGIVGFNINLIQKDQFQGPLSLETFADPRFKGKVGWVDPRSFPFWIPMAVETMGEDKWVDWAQRLDKNVQSYYNGWVNNRIALQRGEVAMALHNASSLYTSAVVDKASVSGLTITAQKPSWCPMPVTVAPVKNTPRREAALRVLDMISSAPYSLMLTEVGVNPSNNPENFPNPMATQMMQLFDGPKVGLNEWHDIEPWILPLDWMKWVGQLKKYNTIWEEEVLKRRA